MLLFHCYSRRVLKISGPPRTHINFLLLILVVGAAAAVAGRGDHSHAANAVGSAGTLATPAGNLWAGSSAGDLMYNTTGPNSAMISGTIGPTGGSQPHQNMQPYLTLNLAIALVGIFPSRN